MTDLPNDASPTRPTETTPETESESLDRSGSAPSSRTRFLDRPKGRIAYDVTGEGPLVVAVPGMGDLRSNFRYLTPVLVKAGYRVATMDLRGHGESDATFDAYDDVAAGSDVLALIDHLGGPAAVIGNSMGAGAAAWAAAERPEAVTALVLAGPFVRNAPTGLLKVLLFRLALFRPWGRAAWTAYIPNLYPGRPPEDLDEHRSRIRESLRGSDRWRAFSATTHTSHEPVHARLGEVRAPTLVVMGDADPDFADPRTEADYVASRLDAETLIVPGAGHYPHAEYPEIVGPAVSGFLDRVSPRA